MKKALFCLLFLGSLAVAEEAADFDLTVAGEKTWTIRVGWGASSLLTGEDLSPGQLTLSQTLRAEIEGKALGFLTLRASFNDQLGPGFQDFLVTVDRAPWKGELGRFVVGEEGEGLAVYNKRVLGARASFSGDGITGGAIVTRLEGVSESRMFRGEQIPAEASFTVTHPDEPWRAAPYLGSVEGLAYWSLPIQYVEDLTKVTLRVEGGPALWTFLNGWDLGYLREDLAAELVTPLRGGDFVVLGNGGDDLALRTAPAALARRRIVDAIDAHNTRLGLTGDARKAYPFIERSELETQFLADLTPFLAVGVDDDAFPLDDAGRRRYLLLGERDVVEGTVEVHIRLPGEEEFRPSTDPALADYAWTLLPAEGVLRISFPDAFFAEGAARVTFAYRREGTMFMLGLSIVPGSERVYLNGKPLIRGTHYSMDYEVGMLLLFSPLGLEDELRVDFERQRGGLGVVTDYERNLFGVTVSVPGWDAFRFAVYRAMDFGAPGPTTQAMPNTHTVAALSLAGDMGGWTYSLAAAASENIFPSDDNARIPSPNRVHAIATVQAPDGDYVVFAHANGLTVHKDGSFAGYGSGHLSGRAAYALLSLPDRLLVGTDAGLTVVRLTESAPFDRPGSWARVAPDDGPGASEVLALAQGGGLVYLATGTTVAAFAPGDAQAPQRWEKFPLPVGDLLPTSLLRADGQLYLGTTAGLYLQTPGGWTRLDEAGGHVHALLARGEEIYVASDEGIRILRRDAGAGWLVLGRAVYGLAVREGVLSYASSDGLWREGEARPVVSEPVTVVGADREALWTATEANEQFRMDLLRVTERVERFTQARTRMDGRNLARFHDIPPADHTRYGATTALVLSRTLGDWQVELRGSSRLPGYEEVGRPGRTDSHGMGIIANYTAGGPATLGLRARWEVADLSTHPRGKLTGGLDWRLAEAPMSYHLSLTPSSAGDGLLSLGRLEMGWRAGASRQDPSLAWGITTTGTVRHPELQASGQLDANVTLRPEPTWPVQGWTLLANGSLPFRTVGEPGDPVLRLTLRWAYDLAQQLSFSATWSETWRHRLATGLWQGERSIQADVSRVPLQAGPGTLTPRLAGSWRSTPAEWSWDARPTAEIARSPVLVRLGLTAARSFRPDTERSSRTLGFSVYGEHQGWDSLRPSLRWEWSRVVLSHPRYEDQTTIREEISLQLSSTPRGAPWRNTLTVTWKPQESVVTLTDRLSWTLGAGTVSGSVSATHKESGLEVKASGQAGVPLDLLLSAVGMKPIGDEWGVNAEVTYMLGAPAGGAPKHALTLGATLAVRF